jgi:hypothetical protein
MRRRFIYQVVLMTFFLNQSTISPATKTPNPTDPNRYLNAVREFADNVLKHGRDTYGPKHTPLFVDGLNVYNHEPVFQQSKNGM